MKKFLVLGVILSMGSCLLTNKAQAETCTGTLVVDGIQTVKHYPVPDAEGNTWAISNFDRNIQIFEDGDHYCAQAIDTGTFKTIGGEQGRSPQSGDPMPHVLSGNVTGYTRGLITGSLAPGNWGNSPREVDCNDIPDICSGGLTDYWVQNYFPRDTFEYNSETTYSTAFQEWNSTTFGNSGDIHAIVNTTTRVGYATLQAAVDDVYTSGDTVLMEGNVTLTSELKITKPLILEVNGFKIKASFAQTNDSNNAAIGIYNNNVTIRNLVLDGRESTHLNGVNVSQSTGVTLDRATITHFGEAGIAINDSEVSINNLVTEDNGLGGITLGEVEGTHNSTSVNLSGESGHIENGPDIWIPHTSDNITVVDTDSQYASLQIGSTRIYKKGVLLTNLSPELVVTSQILPVNVLVEGGTNNAAVNFAALVGTGHGTLPQVHFFTQEAELTIPLSTQVDSTDSNWDGVIAPPTVTSAPTIVPEEGSEITPSIAIEVGSLDTELSFSRAIRLKLRGQGGKLVGWSRRGVFTPITATCSADAQLDMDTELGNSQDCSITVGNDLVIWAKHLTTFVTYTQTSVPVVLPPVSEPLPEVSADTASLVTQSAIHRSNGGVTRGNSTSAQGRPVGQVLGASTSAENEEKIASIKKELVRLISQLIPILQEQLAAATTAGN